MICFTLLLPIAALSQKKNLTSADYGKWQSLSSTDLSPNGEWIAWRVVVEEDNDTLYVQNKLTNKLYKLEFASFPEFSKNNQWIAYRIGVSYKEAERLREQNKPVENNKMGLLNLQTGKKEIIENMSRYGFSKTGKFLAVSLAPPPQSQVRSTTLLLKNLEDSTTRPIGNVSSFAFNKKGDHLAYIVESGNAAGNSVELFNLASYSIKIIASDTTKFSSLSWSKEGDGLVFFRTTKKEGFEEENAIVYAYTNLYKIPVLKKFDPTLAVNFPAGMRVLNTSNLLLSDDLSSVFFGIKNWTAKPKKDDKKPVDTSKAKSADTSKTKTGDSTKPATKPGEAPKNDKLAAVDIWHWKDPEIQPRQKITYGQDKDQSLLYVWNLDNSPSFQIANDTMPLSNLSGPRKFAVIATNKKYKPAFKEDFADYYIVNTKTAQRKLVLEKQQAGFFTSPQNSPDGKYITYFKDKHWFSYNVATAETVNLTQNVKSDFWNTRDDHPGIRPPFGMAGWMKGDKEILLYDEYDVWAVKPDGKGARKLTDGTEKKIQFRLNRLDFEEPFIDDAKPIYFSAYGDTTKQFGYYVYEKSKLTPLIFENKMIFRLSKATDANSFSYVKQDYNVSPELYQTENFTASKKIVSTNPQQANYNWGKSELVNFKNKKGQALQGALFYPANYEPGKKYPMIVYIYEILSNTVHSYQNPSTRSAYNTTNYTTQGYFVFRPDIVYDLNEPGMSAVNCVVPAVEEVLKSGMIDKDKVGLMGHSWGAYQTSFIITQTDIFKAACAGAPLTDLISMSMSIYWNSGTPDQKIFETSQGRFEGAWFEKLEDHMRNSPMFNASKIKAPLLVAFGDKDGAVDWHQGIEMYGTMRRMEKPHIMLVYADENHGLAKKENQIDYQKRQKEFFEHYLLGKPAEKWITEGVSYLEKMKEREKPEAKP